MARRPARVVFNGVDGRTGGYLVAPRTAAAFAKRIQPLDGDRAIELRGRRDRARERFAVRDGVDTDDLSQAGWGVILPATADPGILEALAPLLRLRRDQAGDRYHEYTGRTGFHEGEDKDRFLSDRGYGPGIVDPARIPYYLLIVGDPETIPYRFQASLDVDYAVGRLHFDALEDYARYARSVVAAEAADAHLAPAAAFFGTRHAGDGATEASASLLVGPLAAEVGATLPDWRIESIVGDGATKARLTSLLGGPAAPALLFSAGHGVGYAAGDALQRSHQGALVTQDWPGPTGAGAFDPAWCVAGDDIPDSARLLGSITFHFACFGAGTPRWDQFQFDKAGIAQPDEIAPAAFVAALPKRLLAHPGGGALAVIGHVERAWGSSFLWGEAQPQRLVFHDTLVRLMRGRRVGDALDLFSDRYAGLSEMLTSELELTKETGERDPYKLASIWTATNDAGGYAVLGDPAVRLRTGADAPAERATIASVPAARRRPTAARAGAAAASAPSAAAPSPAAPAPAAPAAPAVAMSASFAFWDRDGTLGQVGQRLADAIGTFADRLGDALQAVVADVTTLTVETWVAEDLDAVTFEDGSVTGGARRRAISRIDLDGDTQVVVPAREGTIDLEVWRVHSQVVPVALAGKTDLLKALTEAAGSLIGALKG